MQHELAELTGTEADCEADTEAGEAPLPVVPIAALAASGTFAAWMSLTCFVC